MIFRGKQWSGFYMRETVIVNGLRHRLNTILMQQLLENKTDVYSLNFTVRIPFHKVLNKI